jgi:hypothetical protein
MDAKLPPTLWDRDMVVVVLLLLLLLLLLPPPPVPVPVPVPPMPVALSVSRVPPPVPRSDNNLYASFGIRPLAKPLILSVEAEARNDFKSGQEGDGFMPRTCAFNELPRRLFRWGVVLFRPAALLREDTKALKAAIFRFLCELKHSKRLLERVKGKWYLATESTLFWPL